MNHQEALLLIRVLAPDICTISRAKYASFRGVSLKVDIRLI